MVQFDPRLNLPQNLPSSEELPCSDDTPVDNVGRRTWRSQDQNFIPNLLLFLLKQIWSERDDWFFGVDMGIYHTTGVSPLVPVIPDGFLSLGVERHKNGSSRKSYVMWEENYTPPIMALEMVSLTYGDEYDSKMDIYAKLGVLYYTIYNPQYWRRDQHLPLEIYRLENGTYHLQIGEPFWMPEIGLGLGRGSYQDGTRQREVLYWFDQQNQRYLTSEERAQRLQQELERYRQQFGELP
jgi:Uma2 family endonuclease